MKKGNLFFVVGIILISAGFFVLLASFSGLTGRVIFDTESGRVYGSLVGAVLLIFGTFLLNYSRRLEKIVDKEYDSAVKSFRRHLEKEYGEKVSYEKAEDLYGTALKKYESDVAKGIIKRGDLNNPVRYIEDLAKSFYLENRIEDQEKERIINQSGKYLSQNRILTTRRELLSLARQCGLRIDEGYKEGTRLVNQNTGAVVSVVPKSNNINRNTAKGIMKSIATGKSSFRLNVEGSKKKKIA